MTQNTKRFWFSLFLATLAFGGCGGQMALKDNMEYENNAVIVKAKKETITGIMRSYGLEPSFEVIDPDDAIYLVRYRGRQDPIKLSASLERPSGIDFAEPNFKVQKEDIPAPKDPRWVYQWALLNLGQDSPHGLQGKPGADIRIQKAWEKTKGSHEIIVAVLDTGVDYTHPDLKPNIWVNTAELEAREKGITGVDDDHNGWTDDVYGWNFVSDERTEPYYGQLGHPDPKDDHGHGTHCAGIIGAVPDNAEGIAGINWNVKIMPLKFLNAEGSGMYDDASRAIRYAIKNKVHIISMSFGGTHKSKLFEHMLQKTKDAGILLVAASGNDRANTDEEPHYPSNYELENIVSVAASNNRDSLASFSNYGIQSVHIAAPGVDIMSTFPTDGDVTSPDYRSWSGTSMATPMVSGAAALLLASQPDLRYQPVEIKKALMASVDQTDTLITKVVSGGRLNVARLLNNQHNEIDTETNEIVTEPITNVCSPRYPNWYPRETVDHVWTISREGAKKIRIFFDEFEIDAKFDLLSVYSKGFRHVLTYHVPLASKLWTPWVKGDTIKVRFANATVEVVFRTEKEFDDWDDANDAGASNCKPIGDSGRLRCSVLETVSPIPNHESEGFRVTQVQYLKRKDPK